MEALSNGVKRFVLYLVLQDSDRDCQPQALPILKYLDWDLFECDKIGLGCYWLRWFGERIMAGKRVGASPMMSRPDLVAYNRNDEVVLHVEVKRKINATREWAAKLRQNLLNDETLGNPQYFLIALPDRFYLWNNGEAASEPNYSVDSRPILQRYVEQSGATPEQIGSSSFELLIGAWLGEVIHSAKSPEANEGSYRWLTESGLYEALVGGRLEYAALS
jgi:hypothetical protein